MQGEEGRIVHTDISNRRGYSDFDAGVAFLCQLTLEEFVQFSVEDTIGNELATLRDGTLCSSHDCGLCKFRCCRIIRKPLRKLLDWQPAAEV
jgi:hypothetical protein